MTSPPFVQTSTVVKSIAASTSQWALRNETPPDELSSLLPDRWIEQHPQHLVQQRVQEAIDRARRTRERREERRRLAG